MTFSHTGRTNTEVLLKSQTWVRKNGGNGVDENFYSATVHSLLKARTSDEFESLVSGLIDSWSPASHDYYKDNIHDSVMVSAAFATSHLDIVSDPYVGITNNVSESYNPVLKDFQNWKVNIYTNASWA